MDPEQAREYTFLEDDILRRLRCHAYIDEQYLKHVFQFLVIPSFSPPIAWDLLCKRREDQLDEYLLFRTVWRSDLDRKKLHTPAERLRHPYPLVPTIELHLMAAPLNELGRLAADLLTLNLPIGASSCLVGADGVTFEFAIDQPSDGGHTSARCRLSWWCEPPTEWVELRSWLSRAENLFEVAWADRGNARPMAPRLSEVDGLTTRKEARRQFLAGHYARAIELFLGLVSRERLTQAEARMLEIALKRAVGGPDGGANLS